MKMKDLMDKIREEILNEFQLDKSILEKVDEFGELSDEMNQIKLNLEEL
jgi:hypothetical protein